MTRTFSRDDWERSLREWDEGKFSDEWKAYRHQASMRGIIFPPEGTRWDSWEDDEPSQRAQVIRAIRETPKLLTQAIGRSKSWYEVVAYVNAKRDETRRVLDDEDRRRAPFDTPRQATSALGSIVDRIAESLGYVRDDRADPVERERGAG